MRTQVLVVDDCPDNLRYIAQIISADHVDLHFAQSEDEALRLILTHPLALALVSSKMPVMDGVELVRLFRSIKTTHFVPVILLNHGNAGTIDEDDSFSLGVVDHMGHPLNAQALKGKVEIFVRLDQQRLKAQEQEQILNLMKDHFVAVVSHELRAPLGSVIGFAELLQSDEFEDVDRKPISEAILRNGEMLLRLVDDILDFSRIEAGKLTLSAKRFELRDFLRKLQTDLFLKAEEKGLALIVDLPEKDLFVVGDPIRIRQMLFNLLGNALKFTERGWVRMTLKAQNLAPQAHSIPQMKFTFRIEDTGIGINSEGRTRLFKPFSQADNSSLSRTYGGTGLGLVISRQLARLMGGDLKLVSSEPGMGSVFEVSMMAQDQTLLSVSKSFSR